MRVALVAAVVWLFAVSGAWAQPPSVVKAALHTVGGDFRRVVSIESGLILGGAGGLAVAVRSPEREVIRLATLADGMDDAFNTAQVLGHGLTQIGGAAGLFIAGRLVHRPRIQVLGGQLLRAQIVSGTLTHSLKFAVRRERPDGGPYSFPSGHTSAAFATATVLQRGFGWKVGAPSYLIASYIGTSRAAANKHYVSDVIMGAAVGFVSGRAVTAVPSTHGTVTLSPIAGRRVAGLMMTWTPRP